MSTWEDNISLTHYGIPHMKWGFRRFQYKNGRLTPEGKERYGVGSQGQGSNDGESKDEAKKRGYAKAKKTISKLNSLKEGPEKDKFVTDWLKGMHERRVQRHKEADEAYHKGGRSAWSEVVRKQDDSEDGQQDAQYTNWLDKEISSKSGDWYHDEGISKGFKLNREKKKDLKRRYKEREHALGLDKTSGTLFGTARDMRIRKKDLVLKELSKEADKLDDDLVGVVLKDLHFPDTAENREYLRPYVIWD